MNHTTTIQEDITELHTFEATMPTYKKDGVCTPEYKTWVDSLVKLKRTFLSKWGVEKLAVFNINRSLKLRLERVPTGTNGTPRTMLNSKGTASEYCG